MNKKVVVGDYTDPHTGIRFIEDDRGNYHMVDATVISQPSDSNITVVIENNESTEKQNKRLRRILESLRMENNWLWSVLETSRQIAKKQTPRKAMDYIDKAIKERQR